MKNTKIVIIEDENLIIKILEFLLKKEGYTIFIAKDGDQGIQLINDINPDIVITDIMLPYKSGLEITAHIKEHNLKAAIIIISALGKEERTIKDSLKLGADKIIAKPFTAQELLSTVAKYSL